ncbi:DNA repair protein RecO [Mycoplasma struthionis]|uniref:DNA repair protein RecO n=1 Tax=Mycoplasma struthionis TaxID=538220 RepID=UPI00130025DE|nr:DNA repair protein RecO [Mycoplasma struthionis]
MLLFFYGYSRKKVIILKKIPVNEYDEIIECLGENGLFSFFAPGIKKITSKNAFNLLLFSLSFLELINSHKPNLLLRLKKATALITLENYTNFLKDIEVIKTFLLKLSPGNCSEIINTYEKLIPLLKTKTKSVTNYLLYKILIKEGINPILDHCAECNNLDNIVDFSFHKGGFLCSIHSKNEIDVKYLRAIYYINKDFETFDKACDYQVSEYIYNILVAYLNENM